MRGGAGLDTFRLTAGDFVSGKSIAGDAGSLDTIQLENVGNLDLRVGTVTGIEELHYFSGTSAITIQSDVLNGFQSIVGSSAADALVIVVANNPLTGTNLTFTNWTVGQDTITIVGAGNDIKNDIFNLPTGAGGGGAAVTAGGGDDTIIMGSTTGTLDIDGGTGTNTLTLRGITVDESGYTDNSTISNIQRLVYDTGNSTLTVSAAEIIAGQVATIMGLPGPTASWLMPSRRPSTCRQSRSRTGRTVSTASASTRDSPSLRTAC